MAGIPRLKPYAGPTLLSYGFRPFFLLGSIWAGLEVLAWLPVFYGELTLTTAFAPRDWHVHELLFGFVPAIVAGFLLTAIPNWTVRRSSIPGWTRNGVAAAPNACTIWSSIMNVACVDCSTLCITPPARFKPGRRR